MQRINYQVVPNTSYDVVRTESDGQGTGGVQTLCTHATAALAFEVGTALCKAEQGRLLYPPGDERIQYPLPVTPIDEASMAELVKEFDRVSEALARSKDANRRVAGELEREKQARYAAEEKASLEAEKRVAAETALAQANTKEAPKKLVMICGVDCHPGDAICNNYCNSAPEKGPMVDAPPPGPDAVKKTDAG